MLIKKVCTENDCASKFLCKECRREPEHFGHAYSSLAALYEKYLEDAKTLPTLQSENTENDLQSVRDRKAAIEKRMRHEIDVDLKYIEEMETKRSRARLDGLKRRIESRYAKQLAFCDSAIDDLSATTEMARSLQNTVDPFTLIEGVDKYRQRRENLESSSIESIKGINATGDHIFEITEVTTRTTRLYSSMWQIANGINLGVSHLQTTPGEFQFQLHAEKTIFIQNNIVVVHGTMNAFTPDLEKALGPKTFSMTFTGNSLTGYCRLQQSEELLNPENGFLCNDTLTLSFQLFYATITPMMHQSMATGTIPNAPESTISNAPRSPPSDQRFFEQAERFYRECCTVSHIPTTAAYLQEVRKCWAKTTGESLPKQSLSKYLDSRGIRLQHSGGFRYQLAIKPFWKNKTFPLPVPARN